MKTRNIVLNLMLLFIFMLAACGGTAPNAMEKPAEPAMLDKPTEEAMIPKDTPVPDAMAKSMAEAVDWILNDATKKALQPVGTGEK